MTLSQAYTHLDLLLDKADQPYFTNSEKDIFLQLAVTEFVNKYYRGYGLNQEYRDGLSAFERNITKTTTNVSNGRVIAEDDYIHLISFEANGSDYKIVSASDYVNIVGHDNLNIISKDPFHDTKNEPLATVIRENDVLYIKFHPFISSGEDVYVHYIRQRTLTDLFDNSALALKDQHQVLKIATRMLTANIESSNYEVQVKETE
tara:strand:+ start:651 stop:1262 length:612 start_codon:yes stop_codon:yes gene_type:complete